MNALERSYQFYKDLPSWGKAVVIIGGGAITWFGILNPVRKMIIKKLDQSKYNKTIGEFKDDIRSLSKQGINPSFTDAQYRGWSDAIENQFSGCDWSQADWLIKGPALLGTLGLASFVVPSFFNSLSSSGKLLYAISSALKNDADFAKLVTAFGSRTYDQCGFWPFAGDITADLYKAVDDELSSSEKEKINKLLASKKIKYQF